MQRGFSMAEFRIETERLVLRDWREEDWSLFFEHTNNPEVMEHLGGVLDQDKKAWMRGRLEGYQADSGHTFWVVQRNGDRGHLAGEIIGFCGLKKSNQAGGPMGEFEIGWRLRKDAWGKGYAREAAEASLKAGFEQFDAPHIIALTVIENWPSWILMDRLGMQRREDLDFENDDFGPAGTVVIVYSITREEWASSRA